MECSALALIITEPFLLVKDRPRGTVLEESFSVEALAVSFLTTTLGKETIVLGALISTLSWGWGCCGGFQSTAAAGDVPRPVADLHHGVIEGAVLAGV